MKKYEDGVSVEDEKDVEKFTVHYLDGTDETIEKGFFCEIRKENGEDILTFVMCHCSGDDLRTIIAGCTQLGFELGYFD